MNHSNRFSIIKIILVIMTILSALQAFPFQAQTAGVTEKEDEITAQFTEAKKLFFAKEYAKAKEILQKAVVQISKDPDREILKGEIFLLMGAIYERIKNKTEAFRFFCLAKQLLGKGKSIEGLDLSKFKQYKKDCPLSQAYTK